MNRRHWLLSGLLLGSALSSSLAAPLVSGNERVPGSDAEPVDPAEQRPAVLPPPRPAQRGSGPTWVALGPSPTISAQVDVPPNNPVCGAIQSIAAHPSDANILYVGAVNGGLWRTTNATAASPNWTRLGDGLVEFDLAFAPEMLPMPVRGRGAMKDLLTGVIGAMFDPFRIEVTTLYPGADGQTVVAEYTSDAVVKHNGKQYVNRYVGIFRFEGEAIRFWREYHNTETATAALA